MQQFWEPSLFAGVSAFAAILAAVIAFYEARLLRKSNTATLILKLDDRFNEDYRDTRKKAAASLQNKPPSEGKNDIEDILDFFETIGIMMRRRIIDKELVWHTFFYWIHGYYFYAKDFIEQQQKSFLCRYVDFTYLHTKALRFEQRKCGRINQTEWDEFLREEQEQAEG